MQRDRSFDTFNHLARSPCGLHASGRLRLESSDGSMGGSKQATAFRVTRSQPSRRFRREKTSGGADARHRNIDANLTTEQLEQHGHPTIICETLQNTAVFREDAVDEPHRA